MESRSEPLGTAYTQLRQGLLSYLSRRLPHSAHAEDLLQDVFLKAISALKSNDSIDNLTGWLYTIARSTLADYYRAHKVKMEELDFDIETEDDDNFERHQELANCLQPFIDELPALYRDTLIANELQGKKLRTLAHDEGLSLSAIKSRAARGRSLLKEKLLNCCEVELRGGLVDDYFRNPSPAPKKKCDC